MKNNKYTYTKGDCYAISQFLERLTEYTSLTNGIAESLGYKAERINNLLTVLHNDIDEIIASEQDGHEDTDIMELRHKAEQEDIANWSFSKVMELPNTDPRLLKYLKLHHKKWKAEKEDDKIEALKDKIVDGLTDGVYSQDYTQLVARDLDKELENEIA